MLHLYIFEDWGDMKTQSHNGSIGKKSSFIGEKWLKSDFSMCKKFYRWEVQKYNLSEQNMIWSFIGEKWLFYMWEVL